MTLATEDQEKLARLIGQLPDAHDHEKSVAAGAIVFPEELDWGPHLSLILTRILLRRMKQLENQLMHRVIDVSVDYLGDAIGEGDLDKAELAARVAFNQAESLVKEEG